MKHTCIHIKLILGNYCKFTKMVENVNKMFMVGSIVNRKVGNLKPTFYFLPYITCCSNKHNNMNVNLLLK